MAKIRMSREAAMNGVRYSIGVGQTLTSEVYSMDSLVNSIFTGNDDSVVKAYLQLFEDLKDLMRIMEKETQAISNYCTKIVKWIDEYSGY